MLNKKQVSEVNKVAQAANDDAQFVAQAERELAQAHVQMDLNKIDDLLHPDYTILQPGGDIENKGAVLASYQQGTRHWDSATVADLDVTVSGNLALVSGLWIATGQNGQDLFDYTARFLSMWRKDNDQWQNIVYQSTEILDQED